MIGAREERVVAKRAASRCRDSHGLPWWKHLWRYRGEDHLGRPSRPEAGGRRQGPSRAIESFDAIRTRHPN